MAPVQPNTAAGGEKKKITLEQLIAQSESDGFEVEGKPEAAPDMSMEEKVDVFIKGTGGVPQQGGEGITPEQQAVIENQYRQSIQMKILLTEKELRTKHTDASEAQLWEAANAFLQGDVLGVSEIMGKMYQTAADKDKEQASKDMGLAPRSRKRRGRPERRNTARIGRHLLARRHTRRQLLQQIVIAHYTRS